VKKLSVAARADERGNSGLVIVVSRFGRSAPDVAFDAEALPAERNPSARPQAFEASCDQSSPSLKSAA
jgi:hypothetical protein